MVFSQYIGMQYADTDGVFESWIDIDDHHKNPTGNINGGVLISLADNLATGAANHYWHEKTGEQAFLVGVDLHAVMLSNQTGGGRITARSTPVRVGRRVTVIRTVVFGANDIVLAEITTTHLPVG